MSEKFNNDFKHFNLILCYDENEVFNFISFISKIYKNYSFIKFKCDQIFNNNIISIEKANKLKYKNHVIFTDEYNIEKISKKQVNKFNTPVFSFFVNKKTSLNLFAVFKPNLIFSPKTIKNKTSVYLDPKYLNFKKWLCLTLNGEYYLNIKSIKFKSKKITLEYLLDNQDIFNNYEYDYLTF